MWIGVETDAGPVPAVLMDLGPFDLEGQAFIAFVPGDRQVGDVYAHDANGLEMGRESVDLPSTP